MEHRVEEDWYAMEDKHVIGYLKQIASQQEYLLTKVDQLAKKIDSIESSLHAVEDKLKDNVDVKKVEHALRELTIIKEREINILLREHIPFPYQHPSPIFRRKPFSMHTTVEKDTSL